MSRWYAIKPNKWSFIRHNLESFGIEHVEEESLGLRKLKLDGCPHTNTIIRSFNLWKPMRIYKVIPEVLLDLLKNPVKGCEI